MLGKAMTVVQTSHCRNMKQHRLEIWALGPVQAAQVCRVIPRYSNMGNRSYSSPLIRTF